MNALKWLYSLPIWGYASSIVPLTSNGEVILNQI
jgi:hypothetical protein